MRYDWYSKTMALSPGAAAEGFQFVYATKTRPVNEPQPQLSMLGFKEVRGTLAELSSDTHDVGLYPSFLNAIICHNCSSTIGLCGYERRRSHDLQHHSAANLA